MELRERLAQLRRSHKFTLRDLRERIEAATGERMAVSYLSALERVERAPSIGTLSRIAAGYGITLQELLQAVGSDKLDTPTPYPEGLQAAARKRGMTAAEMEDVVNIQYRGRRPEAEAEWDAILSVLSLLGDRNQEGGA